jgi:hypothetical protein
MQRPANTLASVLRLPFFEKETMIAFDMLHIVWLGVVRAQIGAFLRAVPESVLSLFNAFLTRQCYAYAGIGRLVNGTADLWNGGDYKALAYSLPFALAALAPIAVADLADAVDRRLTVALLQSHIKAATLLADPICAISRPSYNANTLAATATVIETWCTFVVANISRGAAQHWNFPKFHLLRNHVVDRRARRGRRRGNDHVCACSRACVDRGVGRCFLQARRSAAATRASGLATRASVDQDVQHVVVWRREAARCAVVACPDQRTKPPAASRLHPRTTT